MGSSDHEHFGFKNVSRLILPAARNRPVIGSCVCESEMNILASVFLFLSFVNVSFADGP